jgi:hypothetical protein
MEIFRRLIDDCSSFVVIWYLIGKIGLNDIGDVLLRSDNELFERELNADRIVLQPSIDEPLE